MDAMQNDSANQEAADPTDEAAQDAADAGAPESKAPETDPAAEPEAPATSTEAAESATASAASEPDVPKQRSSEPEAPSAAEPAGKTKKRKSAPKSKSAAGSKALVVLREGKVHYADETVVVLDLDEASHPDTDVHDVVDKLSELRDAAESTGRAEAVTLVAELIQAKALA